MRIAISGSHSLGKSTFVQDFLEKNPDYQYEQEPYRALMNQYEILFGDLQTQNHIDLQLNYCIQTTLKYQAGNKVIFDRCPVDYIPYADYTAKNAHTDIDDAYVSSLYHRIQPALEHLDIIVFVPIRENYKIELEDDGHRPVEDLYRTWVDAAFKKLYRNNFQDLQAKSHKLKIIEISGPRDERVKLLEKTIEEYRK